MIPAKKLKKVTEEDICAEIFISELVCATGVSKAFIEAAIPAIKRAFTEVPIDRREPLLEQIRELVFQQARTEKTCKQAVEAARCFADTSAGMMAQLEDARNKMTTMRNALRSAALSLYGTSSNPSSKPPEA